jgi:cation:H+ antiporter
MIAALTFLGGLVGLLIGGHFVVDASSKIGLRFGLTPMVIGLTIVAAGTSAPELAVVSRAIAADDTELAVGSIIGSNIANILLVLGLAAASGAIRVTTRVVRVDIPIMISASVAFLVMSIDGVLSRVDGVLLFCGLVVFVVWTLRAAPKNLPSDAPPVKTPVESGREGSVEDVVYAEQGIVSPRASMVRHVFILVAGVAVLAVAARFVVQGAEEIATSLGVPELIVGLTIVALGTSAPEIVTTLIAALQGRRELAIGNAVGSNIFNILLVLGASSTVAAEGIPIGTDAIKLDLPIMVAAAVACLPVVFWDHKLATALRTRSCWS